MREYQVVEVPPTEFEAMGAPANWKDSIDKANTTAICVFARGAGEGNTYAPGSALDYYGNATGDDPLALSPDELALIDVAKETCSKVIVLVNSGNNMVLKEIAAGGAHEVDGIAYIGVINDYQCTGSARSRGQSQRDRRTARYLRSGQCGDPGGYQLRRLLLCGL